MLLHYHPRLFSGMLTPWSLPVAHLFVVGRVAECTVRAHAHTHNKDIFELLFVSTDIRTQMHRRSNRRTDKALMFLRVHADRDAHPDTFTDTHTDTYTFACSFYSFLVDQGLGYVVPVVIVHMIVILVFLWLKTPE